MKKIAKILEVYFLCKRHSELPNSFALDKSEELIRDLHRIFKTPIEK